ncbi:MAG: TIGR03936 family radical SAM-associated protein [Desulfovibrio sp.]|nr:TIGR03936 family radical SAM-associated protein [Desulfovibrio sp.]
MRTLLPLLPRPTRYLGSEDGSLRTPPTPCRARMALAFPDLYEVGMSYTGQAILLHTVNARPGLFAERVYAPDDEAAAIMVSHGARLSTLETGTPLDQCDVVGLHLTHELCATTALWMLDLAGIPRRSEQRAPDAPAGSHAALGGWPLILGGGGITCNAEFLTPFFDAMVLGDGEAILPAVLEAVAEFRDAGRPRRELLQHLATMPGLYVPSVPQERVERVFVPDLNAVDFPLRSPQAFGAVHDRFTIEIARGCTRGCRFCHAGMVYRPVRERSLDTLERIVDQGIQDSGYEELSFLSLSTGDFSALEQLFQRSLPRCRAEQVSISLPSLRVGSISPAVMAKIAGLRRTGVTIAPEAGSQRLRDVINKGVTEEALLEHVRELFRLGWDQVKLYFMLGLPTETQADLDAILDLCRKVEAVGREVKDRPGRLQVTAAVSTFVPKPHTPFQWERQLSLGETRERIGYLKSLFKPHRRLALKFHMPEMSWLEGVFSRADRRLAQAVELACDLGVRFDSWTDRLDISVWRQVFAQCGIDADAYLDARDPAAPLPWEHLHPGVRKAFLLAERRRALAGSLTEDCRYGRCTHCGACEEHPAHWLNQTTRDQAAATPSREVPQDDPGEDAPAKASLGEKAVQLRLWYEKLGPAAYLSQRELGQVFERAFRRARLPLSFSQGFHPLPRISFGRALPVGVESLQECLDLWLREPLEAAEVLRRLGGRFPAGIRMCAVEDIGPRKQTLDSTADLYRLELPPEHPLHHALPDLLAGFLALPSSLLTLSGKKGDRTLDVRPMLADAQVIAPGTAEIRLNWVAGYVNPLALVRHLLKGAAPGTFRLLKVRHGDG